MNTTTSNHKTESIIQKRCTLTKTAIKTNPSKIKVLSNPSYFVTDYLKLCLDLATSIFNFPVQTQSLLSDDPIVQFTCFVRWINTYVLSFYTNSDMAKTPFDEVVMLSQPQLHWSEYKRMLDVLYLAQRDCIVFENEEIDKYPISVEEVASDKENSEWGISCVGRINNLLKRILHGANYSFARRPKLFATHRHQMKFFFFESENLRPPIGLGLWLALSTSLANEVFEEVLNLLVIEAAEKRVAEISTGSAVHWPLQASPAVTTTTNIQVTDQELIDEVFKVVSSEQKVDILTECVVDQAIRSFEYEEVLKDQLEVFIYD